jgi:hypothetical protein
MMGTYSKAPSPGRQPFDAQFRAPSVPALKTKLNLVAAPTPAQPQGLKIGSTISKFETALASLVDSVAKFNPSSKLVQDVIDADAELSEAVSELLEHQEAGKTIKRLETISNELDKQLNAVLLGLSESRRELQTPLDGHMESETTREISADELLSYATKITKFTHAPPGYNPEIANEHATFPWPTEDDLRKGMLAMSAVSGEQDETAMTQPAESKSAAPDAVSGTAKQPTLSPQQEKAIKIRRRSSLVSYGEKPVINPSGPADRPNRVLDLDLFDPDEEDEEE